MGEGGKYPWKGLRKLGARVWRGQRKPREGRQGRGRGSLGNGRREVTRETRGGGHVRGRGCFCRALSLWGRGWRGACPGASPAGRGCEGVPGFFPPLWGSPRPLGVLVPAGASRCPDFRRLSRPPLLSGRAVLGRGYRRLGTLWTLPCLRCWSAGSRDAPTALR